MDGGGFTNAEALHCVRTMLGMTAPIFETYREKVLAEYTRGVSVETIVRSMHAQGLSRTDKPIDIEETT